MSVACGWMALASTAAYGYYGSPGNGGGGALPAYYPGQQEFISDHPEYYQQQPQQPQYQPQPQMQPQQPAYYNAPQMPQPHYQPQSYNGGPLQPQPQANYATQPQPNYMAQARPVPPPPPPPPPQQYRQPAYDSRAMDAYPQAGYGQGYAQGYPQASPAYTQNYPGNYQQGSAQPSSGYPKHYQQGYPQAGYGQAGYEQGYAAPNPNDPHPGFAEPKGSLAQPRAEAAGFADPASDLLTVGPYIGVNMQYVMSDDWETSEPAGGTGRLDTTTSFDYALGFGAVGGYRFAPFGRIEAEWTAHSASVDERLSILRDANGQELDRFYEGTGDLEYWTLMGNLIGEMPIGAVPGLAPFAGVGLGTARRTTGVDREFTFATQGLIGVGYALNQQAEIDLGYRYLYIDNLGTDDFDIEHTDHIINLGLRFHF